jgi:hypothetical protein
MTLAAFFMRSSLWEAFSHGIMVFLFFELAVKEIHSSRRLFRDLADGKRLFGTCERFSRQEVA